MKLIEEFHPSATEILQTRNTQLEDQLNTIATLQRESISSNCVTLSELLPFDADLKINEQTHEENLHLLLHLNHFL